MTPMNTKQTLASLITKALYRGDSDVHVGFKLSTDDLTFLKASRCIARPVGSGELSWVISWVAEPVFTSVSKETTMEDVNRLSASEARDMSVTLRLDTEIRAVASAGGFKLKHEHKLVSHTRARLARAGYMVSRDGAELSWEPLADPALDFVLNQRHSGRIQVASDLIIGNHVTIRLMEPSAPPVELRDRWQLSRVSFGPEVALELGRLNRTPEVMAILHRCLPAASCNKPLIGAVKAAEMANGSSVYAEIREAVANDDFSIYVERRLSDSIVTQLKADGFEVLFGENSTTRVSWSSAE